MKKENQKNEEEKVDGATALGAIQGLIGIALVIYGIYILFFR
jgi:hypothetical protein